jgi:O-antigen ligase
MRTPWPAVIASADCVAILAYIIGIEPLILQVAALVVKIACLPFLFRHNSIAVVQLPTLAGLVGLCLVSLAFASEPTSLSIAQSLGFLVHLTLTLFLVVEEIPAYLRSVAHIAATSALIYLGFAAVGNIEIIWGRHYYFNELQPNVGGEIAAAGVLCGAIALPIRRFFILSTPLLASSFLLEARSAMLAIVTAIVLRSAREIYTTSRSRRTQWWTIILAPIGVVGVLMAIPFVIEAMMLKNEYRGLDAGLGGRDRQWRMAWDAFIDRPLTGQGLGWITATQDLGAHQFFLYALAEMGLLALPVFLGIIFLSVRAFLIHGWKVVAVFPVIILMLVNDRFINLNLYPFIFWVMLFSLSAKTWLEPVARVELSKSRILNVRTAVA